MHAREKIHTGLRTRDNVMATEHCGDAVCLNRSRDNISAKLDVLHHDWVEAGILELVQA